MSTLRSQVMQNLFRRCHMSSRVVRWLCQCVAAAALIHQPLNARASELTGHELLDRLNLPETSKDRVYAVFLVGNVLFDWNGKSHYKPPRATLGQAVAITKNFLVENPQLWHVESPYLIAVALGVKWPCPGPSSAG